MSQYPDDSKSNNRDKNSKNKFNSHSPLQGNHKSYGYGGTSKDMSEQEEIHSPLLSNHDSSVGIGTDFNAMFQTTPLQTHNINVTTSTTTKGTPGYQNERIATSPSQYHEEQQMPGDLFNLVPRGVLVGSPSSSNSSATTGSPSTTIRHRPSIASQNNNYESTNRQGDPDIAKEPKPAPKNWASVKRMLARMAPEKNKIIVGVIAMMVGSLCTLLIPLAVGKLVDLVGKDTTTFKDVRWILFAAMGAVFVNAIANFVQLSLLLVAGDKVVAMLRIELFKSLIYRTISFFDTARVGELLSRLSTDVNVLNQALTVDIAELGQRAAVIGGSLIYMLYISWDLSMIVFIIAPLIGITASRLARLFHIWAAKVNDALAQASIVAEETLSSIRTVRALGMEYTQQLRYNEKIITSYRLNRKQKLMKSGQRTFVYFAAGVAVVGVLWYGAWKVIEKQLTAGDLLTFIIMGLNVGENSGKMLDNWTNITTAAASCSVCLDLVEEGLVHNQLYLDYKDLTPWHNTTNEVDFDQILKNMGKAASKDDNVARQDGKMNTSFTSTLILDPDTIPVLPKLNCDVPLIFDNVVFAYPSRPDQQVLRGVSMNIRPRSQIAFVGASGSGKSSAFATILQLYKINKGAIKLGDTNIESINPVLWRASIGYVEQMPTLFNDTIVNNVLSSVCHFRLHDCDHSIQQIRTQREEEKKFFSSLTTPTHHEDDVESRPNNRHSPSQRSHNPHSPRRSSVDSITEHDRVQEDAEIICPCRSNHNLPLAQDLFGRQYTMNDVKRACELAHAHEFITQFPGGYYTNVGDRSVALSGGQRQRISIARAFLADRPIILLDEVSSALDLINEDIIVAAINKLVVGKTVITIAHRLSTIKHIGVSNPDDKIFVFKGGLIAEEGSHAELMAKENGEFKTLSDLQQLVQAASSH